MWRFLLGLVAIVTAIILIGMSVAGGHGMFKNEWLQFGASVGVGIIDVAEIAFLLAMIAMAFEGSWGRAALCGTIWLALSAGTVFTSQAWLKSEIAEVWKPTEDSVADAQTAQRRIDKAQDRLTDPSKSVRMAAALDLPKAKKALEEALGLPL